MIMIMTFLMVFPISIKLTRMKQIS